MKMYPKIQRKYPVSINIVKSLRMFCIVTLQHQALFHIIALDVSICIYWIVHIPNQVL